MCFVSVDRPFGPSAASILDWPPFRLLLQTADHPGAAPMAVGTAIAAIEALLPSGGEVALVSPDPLFSPVLLRAVAGACGGRARLAVAMPPRPPDSRTADWLAGLGARVTLAVDGWPVGAGQGPHLDAVAATVATFGRAGVGCDLCVALGEVHADRVGAAAAALSGAGVRRLRIVPRLGAETWRRASRRAWIDGTLRLTRSALGQLLAGATPAATAGIGRVAAHLLGGRRRSHPCAAGEGLLAVTVAGDVYPCPAFFGVVDFRMGNVCDPGFPGAGFARGVERLQMNAAEHRPKCANCRTRAVCGGECPARCQRRHGDIALPSTDHCDLTKRLVRETTELIASVADGCRGAILDAFAGSDAGCPGG